MNWTPLKHSIIKDEILCDTIHENGYAIEGNIGAENVKKLYSLYKELHHFKVPQGGNFYSLYSDDIAYRKKVHDAIGEVLYPVYDTLFTDYKSVINSFIIKVPGPQSEFTLHQDSTGLDEMNYSSLSIWIPLQDTNLENGTLCMVPKTHRFFHPYRGISFAPPFQHFETLLRTYLVPLELKAGDIVLFDNRTVHYSHLNKSNADRVVVMSGLYPIAAKIEMCYRDESTTDSPIEIYEMEEDFLLTNTAFFNDCTARPTRGTVVRTAPPMPEKSMYDFMTYALQNGVKQTNIDELVHVGHTMNIVSEPV
jgi:hypothetical protein